MKANSAQLGEQTLGPEAGVYTWTFPGAPIRIEIRLDVIARLEAAVTGSGRNRGATELGGVLFGDFRSPGTVEVNDYALIDCDTDSRDGYIADAYELERLCSRKDPSTSAGQVVGYFRTQQEGILGLRDEEMEIIQRYFNDSRQVVLLIRSSAEQCAGGFLFWDERVLSPFSFLEFPFAATALHAEVGSNPGALAPETPVVKVAPSVKVGLSKRMSVLPAGMLLALAIGCVALIGVLAVLGLKMWRRPVRAPLPVQPATVQIVPAPAPLQLQVEAEGNGLNVRWNPASTPIAKAREGRLTILENESPRTIVLNSEELARGHVYYQPSADHVEFQLEVIDDAGVSTEEFVLALSSKTANSVQSIPLARPDKESAEGEKNREPERPVRQTPRVFTMPPRKQNEAPAPSTLIQDAPPTGLIAATPPSMALPRISAPQLAPPVPAERPQNTPSPSASKPAETKAPIRPAERFQLAVPKKKVTPVLQSQSWIAASLQFTGTVQVILRVHIDEAGRVTRAEPTSNNRKSMLDRQLEKVAIDAATQWSFDPALLNDKPVASDQDVTFVFQRPSTH